MTIDRLILKNFRNHEHLDITFNKTNNILMGENGKGKTNILEAIYLLGMMKSFRPALDKDLVQQSQNSYFIKGIYDKTSISIGFHEGKKEVCHNDQPIKRISTLIGKLKVAILNQLDIHLIIGSPSNRRRYLDIALSLSYEHYLVLLQRYQRVVKQRNKLLKSGEPNTTLIKVWDEQLIDLGSNIIQIRNNFFEHINELTKNLYNSLSFDIKDFHLCYSPSIGKIKDNTSINAQFSKKINDNKNKELHYKQTLYGPHKDDFIIKSGEFYFKHFASQGQNRAGAMTLKLAMIDYIEMITDSKMILLLDDVLLDLDNHKKEKFLSIIRDRQNIFTATSLYGLNLIKEDSMIYEVS